MSSPSRSPDEDGSDPPGEHGSDGESSTSSDVVVPSQLDTAVACLKSRGIFASRAPYDAKYDGGKSTLSELRKELASMVGGDHLGGGLGVEVGLVGAFDAPYASEKDFDIAVFRAVVGCFRREGGQRGVQLYRSDSATPSPMADLHSQNSKDWPHYMIVAEKKAKSKDPEKKGAGGSPPASSSSSFCAVIPNIGPRGSSAASDEPPSSDDGGGRREAAEDAAPAAAKSAVANEEKREKDRSKVKLYAMGLAREGQVPATKDCIVTGEKKGMARPDHAWDLFERDGENEPWRVCQVLAVVELKMDSSMCHVLRRCEDDDATVEEINLEDARYKPLAQEIMYVVGHVLWSRAAMGVEIPETLPETLPESPPETLRGKLPWAVLAAAKKEEKKKKKDDEAKVAAEESAKTAAAPMARPPVAPKGKDPAKARWAHGHVVVPEERGGAYAFTGASSKPFRGTTGVSPAAIYVSIMAEGMRAAEGWLAGVMGATAAPPPDDRAGEGRDGTAAPLVHVLKPPRSMCGRMLYFGTNLPLDLIGEELVATPASMRACPLRMGQGELFRGRVRLADLCNATKDKNVRVVWSDEGKAPEVESAVLVKVTSKACHSVLVPFSYALLWRLSVTDPIVKEALKIISPSLHAVYAIEGPRGLVQLMPDLSEDGFAPLRPKELGSAGSLRKMCDAFIDLVKGTLIPLAKRGVIHADLRPGYDRTANILYNKSVGMMRLIDMDSLLYFEFWESALTTIDKRILAKVNGSSSKKISSALMFVMMQAVCVATAWLEGLRDNSMVQQSVNTDKIIKSYMTGKDLSALHKALNNDPCEVIVTALKKVLDDVVEAAPPIVG